MAVVLAALPGRAYQVPRRHFTIQDGLSQSQVSAIAQDGAGFLWVATWGGLSRFDGARFVNLTTRDGLPDDVVSAVAPAAGFGVWIGTRSGQIARWDGHQVIPYRCSGLPAQPVQGLWDPGDGRLWAGLGPGGLHLCEAGGGRRVMDRPVTAIEPGPDGTSAWLLAGGDLWELNRDGVSPLSVPGCSSPCDVVAVTTAGPDADLWLATRDGRILRRGGRTWERSVSIGETEITSIAATPRGSVWLGTRRGLVEVTPEDRVVWHRLRLAATTEVVSVVRIDDFGNLWAGTWGDGLYRVQPRGVSTFTLESGFPDLTARAFVETRDGCIVAAGQTSGLFSWCGEGWAEPLDERHGLPSSFARALLPGPDGDLWVGTTEGLARVAGGRVVETWRREDGLPGDFVIALARGLDGALWAATFDRGLGRFVGGAWESWDRTSGLPDDDLRDLAVDPSGRVWIATYSAGVVWFDGEDFGRFGTTDGLPHERVWSLLVDSRGRLWAGTEAGIWVHPLEGGEDFVVTPEAGLPHGVVLALAEDGDGMVWAGTNRGLARIAPDGEVLRVLTTENGLSNDEAQIGSPMLDRHDRLWFGMANGISIVDPRALPSQLPLRGLVLEEVRVNDRVLPSYPPPDHRASSPWPELTLGPRQRDLRFDFVAPDLQAAHRLRYRWQLVGYDPGWNEPVSDQHAVYRGLPPGRYEFRVAASRAGSSGAASTLTVPVVIRAPWYGTPWFRALAGGALVVAAVGFHRWRLHRLRRNEQILQARIEAALADVKSLRGLLPICARCKQIRDDRGYWNQIEVYVSERSEAEFSHGICPDCARELFPKFAPGPRSSSAGPPPDDTG